MKILLLGRGGREHALAWKIAASPLTTSSGARRATPASRRRPSACRSTSTDHAAVVAFCRRTAVDFVVVGPDDPLVAGIVDDIEAAGFRTFGPTKAAARLEGSKGFTKDLCRDIRHPDRRLCSASPMPRPPRPMCARKARRSSSRPTGWRSARASWSRRRIAEAEGAIDMMFGGGFGAAGAEVVIEEFLGGEEASFFALCDGETAIPLASAQDHKRAFDGDKGPNTGGMGAYSPVPALSDALTSGPWTSSCCRRCAP